MADPISIALSGAALVLTAALAYRTQLRRADIKVALLAAPAEWSVAFARTGGAWAVAVPWEADEVHVTGSCPATITNEGAKGGAIWAMQAALHGLGGGWQLNSKVTIPQPVPVASRTCEAWEPTVSLTCRFECLGTAIQQLRETRRPALFRIEYSRVGWRSKPSRGVSAVQLHRQALLAAVAAGTRGAGFDLATLQLVPWARERADAVFGQWKLDSQQLETLTQWIWRDDLEYLVEGDDPDARLLCRPGYTATCILADGHRATLQDIAHAHRELVDERKARVGELRL